MSADLAFDCDGLRRIARSEVPVIVTGETGTGKELIARAVHELSGRSGAFADINCGAIPATLLESELFGHKKGAFSGADADHKGIVRAADHGTLFLDEVAELTEASQVALLRALQERAIRPVGDTRSVSVDIRVVAATHQDLEARLEDGRFRRDLYGRLAGFVLVLPSLSERIEDLGLLCTTLLSRVAGEAAGEVTFQRDAARALFRYDWPMNIRELEQALRVATAMARGDAVTLEHLPPAIAPRPGMEGVPGRPAAGSEWPAGRLGDDELRTRLTELLRVHKGNLSAAARASGKARVQLYRWCKRLGLDVDDFR
jgi:DNA-binding NtrC family response regulator